MNNEQILGWDDSIEIDGDMTTFPAGTEVHFRITKFERGRTADGRAPLAIIRMRATADGHYGVSLIRERISLTSKSTWRIAALFRSIGLLTDENEFTPDWDGLVGCEGRATVTVEKWTGSRDGVERTDNKIERYLYPDSSQAAPAQADAIDFGDEDIPF